MKDVKRRGVSGKASAKGVWQRFATKLAIRALMSDPTRPCEIRLRLAGAWEETDNHPAYSTSRHVQFAIRRQTRTRFAFPENQAREQRRQNTLEMPSLTDSSDHGSSSSEPSSSRFDVKTPSPSGDAKIP